MSQNNQCDDALQYVLKALNSQCHWECVHIEVVTDLFHELTISFKLQRFDLENANLYYNFFDKLKHECTA